MSQPSRTRFSHLTRRFSPALCLLLIGTAVDARAQADKGDEYIEAEIRKQEIPSLALAVVQDGKVVESKAYGLANLELNVAATSRR